MARCASRSNSDTLSLRQLTRPCNKQQKRQPPGTRVGQVDPGERGGGRQARSRPERTESGYTRPGRRPGPGPGRRRPGDSGFGAPLTIGSLPLQLLGGQIGHAPGPSAGLALLGGSPGLRTVCGGGSGSRSSSILGSGSRLLLMMILMLFMLLLLCYRRWRAVFALTPLDVLLFRTVARGGLGPAVTAAVIRDCRGGSSGG